jgi:hypothetical protein
MKKIVSGVLDIYFKKMREPKIEELSIESSDLTNEK